MKLAKYLILSLLCGVSYAEITTQTTDIKLNGKTVGNIKVLTPVEIVNKGEKTSTIKVKGVVSDNYMGRIQNSVSNGEIYVEFNDENSSNFNSIKEIEYDYGEIWHESEGIYEVDSNILSGDDKSEELYTQAKNLYEQSCSSCHILHEPTNFTANQWPAELNIMIDSGYVFLEKNDLDLILKYLQHNAKVH